MRCAGLSTSVVRVTVTKIWMRRTMDSNTTFLSGMTKVNVCNGCSALFSHRMNRTLMCEGGGIGKYPIMIFVLNAHGSLEAGGTSWC